MRVMIEDDDDDDDDDWDDDVFVWLLFGAGSQWSQSGKWCVMCGGGSGGGGG